MAEATPQNVASMLQDVIRLIGSRGFWNTEDKVPVEMFITAMKGVNHCVLKFYTYLFKQEEPLHLETLEMVWKDVVRCNRGLTDEESDIITFDVKSYVKPLEVLHHITNELENSISFSMMESKSDRLPLDVVLAAQNAILNAWKCLPEKNYEKLNNALLEISNLKGFPKGTFNDIKEYLKTPIQEGAMEWEVFSNETELDDNEEAVY